MFHSIDKDERLLNAEKYSNISPSIQAIWLIDFPQIKLDKKEKFHPTLYHVISSFPMSIIMVGSGHYTHNTSNLQWSSHFVWKHLD